MPASRPTSGDDDSSRPLVRSLAAVSGATGWLRVLPAVPHAQGWSRCREILEAPWFLPGWVRRVSQSVADHEGEVPPLATPASYVMGWYLQVPATVGALLFDRFRRVPDLTPDGLAVHRADYGYVDAVAVTERRFRCLPDDPDAGHPDAVPVPDERALAASLRENVVDHARQFHAAYEPGVKMSTRQRWGMVLDVLDTALWQSGLARGDELAGVQGAALVLDGAHPPLMDGTRLRPLGAGEPGWTRRRLSCCFMFASASGLVCTTCPRLGR